MPSTVTALAQMANHEAAQVTASHKGIALIDDSGNRPRIRYVLDASDTGSRDNSRRPFIWQYRQEHEDTVTASLKQ